MNLEALWNYQAADMELDRFENKLKKSETRQRLLKARNFLVEQQENVKKLEESLLKGAEESNRLQAENARIAKEIDRITQEYESAQIEDAKQIKKYIRALEELNKNVLSIKKELVRIQNTAEGTDGKVKQLKSNIVKGKADFAKIKEEHDAELAGATDELERLRAKVSEVGKDVSPELLAEYKKIKKNRPNPVAKVINEQCQGCNMSMPSLVMRKLKEGEKLIECENCGRILYYQE